MTRVILLMGPTASGKSALALALAEALGGEIVTVDSAQVYRGMDIGTAKPDAEERARVPHHLLDIRDPAQAYSAANFATDAEACIAEIQQRGRIPILAGGTMLYFRALTEGLAELPSADPALRAELEAEALRDGWPALHARLAAVDPQTAARLHPNDRARIQRALEIHALSGEPASRLHARGPAPGSAGEGGRFLRLILMPSDRKRLAARITARMDDMLSAGLIDEVAALYARPDLHPDLPSIRAVGYRQYWHHLSGELTLQQARDAALAATRGLAKRQLTWLRGQSASMPESHTLDSEQAELFQAALAYCRDRLKSV
jgi:tRNA dimethylallyltransferase